MPFSVDIDVAEFERAALAAIQQEVYQALVRAARTALVPVQDAVERSVRASTEYSSLLGGELNELFGIADPQPALDEIALAVRNSVQVTTSPGTANNLGTLTVQILRDDLSDVLGLPGASYISRSLIRNTAILVPWLSWLLLAGDRLVVADFEVLQEPRTGSRTGRAIMIQPYRRPPRGFRVPKEVSGVIDDNWLTRCLVAARPTVIDAVLRAVENA